MRFEGKTAIITGAAGGMGAEEARLFARKSARVVISDMSDDLGQGVVDETNAAAGESRYIHTYVSSESAWVSMVDQTLDKFGGLDILVNNAGLSPFLVSDNDDVDAWQPLMDVNLKSVCLGCRTVIPWMKKAGGGSIVNISSIGGITGHYGGHPGYFAAKSGVRAFTKSMAFKHGPDGIRINSVHPGVMPQMRSAVHIGSLESYNLAFERLIGLTPLRRRGSS